MGTIICDNCNNYEVTASGTGEICHAFIDRMNKAHYGITKPYIELRMTAEKKHCKEFKKIN